MMEYIEAIETAFAHPLLETSTKAVIVYFVFFGTRFVSNDIVEYCEEFFSSFVAKFITVFCIFYQATQDAILATTLAAIMITSLFYCKKMKMKKH